MRTEEQTFWIINNYLNNLLGGNDLIMFVEELRNNKDLQLEVEKHKLANELILNNRLLNIKSISKEISQKEVSKIKYKKIFSGFFALTLIGSFFYYISRPNSTTTTITNNLTSHKTPITTFTSPSPKNYNSKRIVSGNTSKKPLVVHTKKDDSILTIDTITERATPEVTTEETKQLTSAEIKPNTKETIAASLSICADIKLTSEISTLPTCVDKEEGLIKVSNISGGKAPFSFQILNSKDERVISTNLTADYYSVLLLDANGCNTKVSKVKVKAIDCNEELAFNPNLGETFEVDGSSSGGTFTVFEKNGTVYFQKQLQPHEQYLWNGNSIKGELETGYFIYNINYNNGLQKNGGLTITR